MAGQDEVWAMQAVRSGEEARSLGAGQNGDRDKEQQNQGPQPSPSLATNMAGERPRTSNPKLRMMIRMITMTYDNGGGCAATDRARAAYPRKLKTNTNAKQTCLQVRTNKFPGKQLESDQQRPEGAAVEPRHACNTIAILKGC
jgi:hypothetical protein